MDCSGCVLQGSALQGGGTCKPGAVVNVYTFTVIAHGRLLF